MGFSPFSALGTESCGFENPGFAEPQAGAGDEAAGWFLPLCCRMPPACQPAIPAQPPDLGTMVTRCCARHFHTWDLIQLLKYNPSRYGSVEIDRPSLLPESPEGETLLGDGNS